MIRKPSGKSFTTTYTGMVSVNAASNAYLAHIVIDKQYSLEHKILIMHLLSRLMGSHKLCVLGFYSYIIKCVPILRDQRFLTDADTSHTINSRSR